MPNEITNNSDEPAAKLSTYYVGDWQVDAAANRLQQGEREVKLEAKVMEVLVYFTQHPNRLITRDELEREVWKDRVVSYEALTSTINKLRKALDDSTRNPRYIETVSKKGYRFIAQIRHEADQDIIDQDSLFSTSAKSWLHSDNIIKIAFALIALFAAFAMKFSFIPSSDTDESVDQSISFIEDGAPSIVVLPFADLSGDTSQPYLGEGITEDLTTTLSKLSGLFVIARSSAMNYKEQPIDIKQIAQKLEVRYVLEGSIRRDDSKIRVNAKLVDGETGFNLWAEQYNREVKELFNVQDDIVAKIVNALSVKITEQEQKRSARQYTTSIEAYNKFLQGQVLYMHFTQDDNLRARELYQHSIELDPGFARAHSAMALTYVAEFRYAWNTNSQETIERAVDLAQTAVALDNQLPQAYWVQGYSYLQNRQYEKAIESAKQAIALSPSYADGYATLGISYIYIGDAEKGLQSIQRAMRLNPQYPAAYASAMGQALYFLQRYEEAIVPLRQAIERNTNLLTSQIFLIATLSRLGLTDDAQWAIGQLRTIAPDFKLENVGDMFPINDAQKLQQIVDDLKNAGLR